MNAAIDVKRLLVMIRGAAKYPKSWNIEQEFQMVVELGSQILDVFDPLDTIEIVGKLVHNRAASQFKGDVEFADINQAIAEVRASGNRSPYPSADIAYTLASQPDRGGHEIIRLTCRLHNISVDILSNPYRKGDFIKAYEETVAEYPTLEACREKYRQAEIPVTLALESAGAIDQRDEMLSDGVDLEDPKQVADWHRSAMRRLVNIVDTASR